MTTTLLNLTSGMCRWPLGDPKDGELQFCGAPSDPSIPYCEKHMAISRAPNKPRRILSA